MTYEVPRRTANQLAAAAATVVIEDEAYESAVVQLEVMSAVRSAAPSGFDDLVGHMEEAVLQPPYYAHIRRLDVSRGGEALLVSLSRAIGELVEPYRAPWSRFIREIQPNRDRIIAGRVLNELLHTDGTDWPEPNHFTCLLCIRSDAAGGGISRLMGSDRMSEIAAVALGDDWSALTVPVPWRIAEELGSDTIMAPVFQPASEHVRWLYYTIDTPSISPDLAATLVRFEDALERSDGEDRLALQPGELLLVNNRACLHARTAICRPSTSSRLLLRTKLKIGAQTDRSEFSTRP